MLRRPDDRVIWSLGDNRGLGAIINTDTDTDMRRGEATPPRHTARSEDDICHQVFKMGDNVCSKKSTSIYLWFGAELIRKAF